jgi:hypothetical protein
MPRWQGSLAGVDRLRGLLWRWSEGQDGSGEGFLGKFGRCRGVGLRCWPLGALGWRGEVFAGDVVVRGATEWPVDGEAEASARRRKKGGGDGGLRGCKAGVRVLGAQEVPFVGRRRCLGVRARERGSPGISGRSCAGEERGGRRGRQVGSG